MKAWELYGLLLQMPTELCDQHVDLVSCLNNILGAVAQAVLDCAAIDRNDYQADWDHQARSIDSLRLQFAHASVEYFHLPDATQRPGLINCRSFSRS